MTVLSNIYLYSKHINNEIKARIWDQYIYPILTCEIKHVKKHGQHPRVNPVPHAFTQKTSWWNGSIQVSLGKFFQRFREYTTRYASIFFSYMFELLYSHLVASLAENSVSILLVVITSSEAIIPRIALLGPGLAFHWGSIQYTWRKKKLISP